MTGACASEKGVTVTLDEAIKPFTEVLSLLRLRSRMFLVATKRELGRCVDAQMQLIDTLPTLLYLRQRPDTSSDLWPVSLATSFMMSHLMSTVYPTYDVVIDISQGQIDSLRRFETRFPDSRS